MSNPILLLVTRPTIRLDATVDAAAAGVAAAADDVGFVQADPGAPQLSVLDQGATRGDGIFETIGVADGQPHALEPHLERFARSAQLLDLPTPDLLVWRRGVVAAIAAHQHEHATQDAANGKETAGATRETTRELSVKIVMTRGIEGSDAAIGWICVDRVGDLSAARTRGIRAVCLDRGYRHDVSQTSPWLLQGAKTLSYAINKAAVREAERRGADDVIFLSADGFVLEGATSNVIVQQENRIRTPGTDLGILAGTTQAHVFEFFRSRGFETEYALIPAQELHTSDAIWLVSSVRQAAPVRQLDGRHIEVNAELTGQLNDYLLRRTT